MKLVQVADPVGKWTVISSSQSILCLLGCRSKGILIADMRGLFCLRPDNQSLVMAWTPAPLSTYSVHCRQRAWELVRMPCSNWERSVPDVADASRSPDPSTVRRWAGRLMHLSTLL